LLLTVFSFGGFAKQTQQTNQKRTEENKIK
jgi:hypothetical protein